MSASSNPGAVSRAEAVPKTTIPDDGHPTRSTFAEEQSRDGERRRLVRPADLEDAEKLADLTVPGEDGHGGGHFRKDTAHGPACRTRRRVMMLSVVDERGPGAPLIKRRAIPKSFDEIPPFGAPSMMGLGARAKCRRPWCSGPRRGGAPARGTCMTGSSRVERVALATRRNLV